MLAGKAFWKENVRPGDNMLAGGRASGDNMLVGGRASGEKHAKTALLCLWNV